MPLLWLSIAFLLGIWLAEQIALTREAWWLAGAAILALSLAAQRLALYFAGLRFLRWTYTRHSLFFVPPFLLPLLVCGGAIVYHQSLPLNTPQHIRWYNDQGEVRLRGMISLPPDRREKVVMIRVETLSIRSATAGAGVVEVKGSLQVMLPVSTPPLRYGDHVELIGKLVSPPQSEGFFYRDYLARQGVYSYMAYPRLEKLTENSGNPLLAAIYSSQETLYAVVQRQFSPPESELLAGILLGIEQGIPPPLMESFRLTGTAHIIAISGFNITILVVFVSSLFLRVVRRRWLAIFLCLAAIAGYTLLVGAAPSVVRAAIMGGFTVLAAEIGRRSTSLNALALTAAVMCGLSPGLLYNASFQLSAAATLGLILFSTPLQTAFSRAVAPRLPSHTARQVTRLVSDYLLTTLAAQITTLPVIAYHFQRFSLAAFFANPLILPPQPLVMMISGAAALAGWILPPLGQMIAWLAQPFAAYTIRMVELLAQIPGGEIRLEQLNPLWLAAYYAVVFLSAYKKDLPGRLGDWMRQTITPMLLLTAAISLAVTTWQAVLYLPDGRLRLAVLNVPDGPAVLVQTPGGRALLVNSGSSYRILLDHLGRRIPSPGAELDWILITDRRASALAAFEGILPRYSTRLAAINLAPNTTRTRERLLENLQQRDVALHSLQLGMRFDLGQNAVLEVIARGKQGAALWIEYGDFHALLPGGMPSASLDNFLSSPSHSVELVILGAADDDLLSDFDWERLAPQIVVVCSPLVGFQPAQPFISIPPGGWFSVSSDGRQMWLETSR